MRTKILLATFLLGLSLACSPRSGEHLGTYEKSNRVFTIRVLAFRENNILGGPIQPAAYYVFESKLRDEVTWREIVIFRDQSLEPFDIEHSEFVDRGTFVNERLNFVNDQVAFVYMGWLYAVTTDAGQTWRIWNGRQYPFPEGEMRYNGIRGVTLDKNGIGTMKIMLIGNDSLTELHTSDYGVNWNLAR